MGVVTSSRADVSDVNLSEIAARPRACVLRETAQRESSAIGGRSIGVLVNRSEVTADRDGRGVKVSHLSAALY